MDTVLIILFVFILLIPLWALFGKDKKEVSTDSSLDRDRDLSLRRRAADREIEEESTQAEPPFNGERREQNRSSNAGNIQPQTPPADQQVPSVSHPQRRESDNEASDFRMPFKSDEIIESGSPYSFYERTMKNAEIYSQKGDYSTAASLYEGIKKRIKDESLTQKIDENIDYLNNYQQVMSHHQEIKKQLHQEPGIEEAASHGIKLSFEGDNSIPENIQIGITPPITDDRFNVDKIVDKIADKLFMQKSLEKKLTESKVEKYEEQISELKDKLEKMSELKEKISSAEMDEPDSSLHMEELEKYKDELNQIKEDKALIDKKQDEFENNLKEIETLKEEINALKDLKSDRESEREKKLENDRSEIEALKDKLNSFHDNEEKKNDEISRLKEEIEKLNSSQDTKQHKSDEIENLKEELNKLKENQHDEKLKNTEDENKLLKENLSKLEKEMGELAQEKDKTKRLEDKIRDLEDSNLKEKNNQLDEKLDEISSLKEELKNMSEMMSQLSMNNEIPESDIKPVLAESKFEAPAPAAPPMKEEQDISRNIHDTVETKENKEEDFELLNEFVKGPQYDTPSEEEIYDKLIKEAVEENQSKRSPKDDIEIIGEKQDDSNYNDIGYEDLVDSETEKKRQQEEAFYTKFLQPDKVKKKEIPILRVSYDFSKLSDHFTTENRSENGLESSFNKYKPMLEKAWENIKRRRVHSAIDYYKVVMDQNIPEEFKKMIKKNINDLNDYLEKYYISD